MKTARAFLISALLALFALAAGGCVMTAEKGLLKSSDKIDMPDISGAFRASKKNETYILQRVDGTTNTFMFTAPDNSTMKLVFEPLKTPGRYMIQVENAAGPEVLLGLCVLQRGAIDLYAINPQAAASLASGKYGFGFNENGQINKWPSLAKVKNFFEAAFDPEYTMKAETITVHSDKDAKPSADAKPKKTAPKNDAPVKTDEPAKTDDSGKKDEPVNQ